MSIFSTIIKSFLHVLSYWKVNYFSKQPCNITKENQIRQAWNFLIEAKTYPGPPVVPRRSSRGIVMLIAQLPARGHWSNPAPLSLDAAPLSRSPSPDGPGKTKLPPAGHRAQSEGKASCACGSEVGLAPPAGRQRRAGSPTLTDLRGLTQKQLCCEHSDWRPKMKCSRIAPWPSSKHG